MKKSFKSQASSARAGGFGSTAFGTGQSSVLSYVQEPPDYSSLGDSNVAIAFKSLSKKDGTTKSKALEELQSYISQPDVEVDDAFLEAWAKVFPRLSIDSARRVRQLANGLNGQVCSKSGKRTVKHMPRIAGPWLAGTFDIDRAAAKAATDALNLVFPTPEKVQGVRKAFQRSIIEYCRDALLHETIQTLSDERSVSAEDAEATYQRVVATSLAVVTSMISELSLQDQEKEIDVYEEVFSDAKLWQMVQSPDASVRRATHRLIRVRIEKLSTTPEDDLKLISNAYVYGGLRSNQTGSAMEFLRTLSTATATSPTIWTDAYTGKKPAISRLRHFLKQGSQSSPAEFWVSLRTLIQSLPKEILPKTVEDVTDLLSSARSGVSKKEERLNAASAWPTYFALVDVVTSQMSDEDAEKVLETELLPVLRQFVLPDLEDTEWTISSARPAQVLSNIVNIAKMLPLLVREWPHLGDKLIELAKVSQPEQSKDYDKSQNNVASTGERWSQLQKGVLERESEGSKELSQTSMTTNSEILDQCILLLASRNGKPYGAAAIIEHLMRNCSERLLSYDAFRTSYTQFLEDDMPKLVFSPSGKHLTQSMLSVKPESDLESIFKTVLNNIVVADEAGEKKLKAVGTLFTHNTPASVAKLAQDIPEFQKFVAEAFTTTSAKDTAPQFGELVRLEAVTTETTDAVLSNLTASLSVSGQGEASLSAIDHLSTHNQIAIQEFMTAPNGNGVQLLPNLLRLEQSPDDEVAERAATVASRLSSKITEIASGARFGVVLQNLERVSQMSMPMDALHDLTTRLIGQDGKIEKVSEMLPSLKLWRSAVVACLKPPVPSMALMSVLGGAVHAVQHQDAQSPPNVQYDAEGFSQALRIAMYVSRLLSENSLVESLGDLKASILALLQLSVRIAEDSVSVLGSNGMWKSDRTLETEAAVLDFISEANEILGAYWSSLRPDFDASTSSEFAEFFLAMENMRADAQETSPLSYYVALCSAAAYANAFEIHGFSKDQTQECENIVRTLRSEKSYMSLISCIVGLQQPLSGTQTLAKLCNELIAQITDADIEKEDSDTLTQLYLLNAILRTQDDILEGIPKQRLIFLVKKLLSSLDAPLNSAFKSEMLKTLAQVLRAVEDMYGEHWEQALQHVIELQTSITKESETGAVNEGHNLLENTTLRLFASLKMLSKSEDANEDLVDALKDKRDEIQEQLVNLLIAADGTSDEGHQPLRITHELLARQIASTTVKDLKNLDDLYPQVYAPSRPIQQASFDLLHKEIPIAQEKVSIDAALDDRTAHLPDELLSLILEAPTLDTLADASFQRTMPPSLQGYLYSWRLIFDHFQSSSYKVKSDYIEQLKESSCLPGLMSLTFDFLGHTSGRPVDVSKFNVKEYAADEEPNPQKDVQWLLAHLYYLALTNFPGLVRSYYLELRSRQLPQTIETWTAKYISPLIIEAAMKDVVAWDEKPNEHPDYDNVTIKVGFKAKEITASYLVDEQTMSMKIVIPEAFPLASAQAVGISRVVVTEEKWQSWLRNCQGVIAFSNGSLIDGLSAWRRNATGAMKGQTECAICYSIVSGDKKLPTKKCPTCKRAFHSSCLAKWFKTSNASTCPLCRTTFSFW